MQIARAVGGFSLGQADMMRRAMSKKKHDEMAQMKVDFVRGAAEREIPEDTAREVWDLLERFADYGFNKSHSAAYAWLAYQTGYLKANHTPEFMAAVMTDEMHDTKKMTVFLESCRKFGIRVLPPDVNHSSYKFRVDDGHIRFGLGAVKNVGESAIGCIVAAREEGGPFADVFDFMERVDCSRVNRKVIESLIQVGAFDSLGLHRATLFVNVELLLNFASVLQEQEARNQISLFGGDDEVQITAPRLDEVPEWSDEDRLAREKELIGIYVSGHPLERFRQEVESFSTLGLDRVDSLADGVPLRCCGIISEARSLINRRNKRMVLGTVEDFAGSLKFMVFEELLMRCGDLLAVDALLSLRGRLSVKEKDDYILIVEDVIPLQEMVQRLGRRVTISIDASRLEGETLDRMESLFRACAGEAEVHFNLQGKDGKPVSFLSDKYHVCITPDFIERLKQVLDGHSVVVSG